MFELLGSTCSQGLNISSLRGSEHWLRSVTPRQSSKIKRTLVTFLCLHYILNMTPAAKNTQQWISALENWIYFNTEVCLQTGQPNHRFERQG